MNLSKYDVKPTALLGELVGTFVLAMIAVTIGQPLIVGFTLVVLVLALNIVSGAHLNPAVTFGFWSVKKISTVKTLFYWLMQFAGAYLALLVVQMFSGNGYGISLASFGKFDMKLVVAELIAVAVFTFAVAAASQRKLADAAKGLCIGLGLMVGLYAGAGLISQAAQSQTAATAKTPQRVTLVDGVTANPAIALALTEKDQSASALSQASALGQAVAKKTVPASRLTLETIVGCLIGGAIGMNLYYVAAGENPFEQKGVKASVARVFKKSKKTVKKSKK